MVKEYKGPNTKEGLLKEIGNKRTVVDFFATWCGPCQMQLGVLGEVKSDDYQIIIVDIDKFRDLAISFAVRSVPTLFLFNEGNIVGKNIGFLNAENLNKWVFSA